MANAQTNTWSGRSIVWNRVRNASGTAPINIGWGDAVSPLTGSASSNVNLFKPQTETRTSGVSTLGSTTFLADTFIVTGTITCAVGAKSITEAGLFDSVTLSNSTTLAAALSAASVTATIGSVTGFPTTGNYYAEIENETVLVTGANSTTLTIVRGRLGSTSAAHVSGVAFSIGGDGGASGSGATSEQTATVAASNGGSMFAHADFAAIALNVNDAIAFTWSDVLSGP